jgi:hypothetical protein
MSARLIHIDGSFDPWKIQPVRHSLADHPMLQIPSLVELGKRLEARGQIRSHGSDVTAATSFNEAPKINPNAKSAVATLSNVAEAKAWMSLLNVQTDEVYRRLVDEVLDDVKPIFDRKDPGMCYRGGWIFVTSPKTITPFHMDTEHNFILQIQGKKRVYVWDHLDRSVVSERGQELFHTYHSRELVNFREEFRAKARVFDLEPGMGGFMPSTSPHLVENGDEPSVTMSFTFYTASTIRRCLTYRGKNHARRLGLSPEPFGTKPSSDELLYKLMEGYTAAKGAFKRMRGHSTISMREPYAHHLFS